jgi:hypothetical protein
LEFIIFASTLASPHGITPAAPIKVAAWLLDALKHAYWL